MKATAIHGYVAFVQREPEEKVTREEAAEFLNEIALAIVSAGDIGDPKSQFFRAAIEKAVKEFAQPGGATKPISAREAARRRMPLDGADAQALEGALTLTERERDEARAEVERLRDMVESLEADFARRQAAHRCATWDDGQGKCECNNLARTVAERQREACAASIRCDEARCPCHENARTSVRATPLVTEVEP